MTLANKNAFDWHCEDHDTYGWRGDECRMCSKAPSEESRLRAEVKILQEQNAALLVAIEAKDAALDSLVSWVDDWAETSDTDFPRIEAQVNAARSSPPSTELLESRDRKWDAKLLRAAKDQTQLVTTDAELEVLAAARESGEWEPKI